MIWLTVAAVSGLGLRYYRIDNSLSNWVPEREAVGPFQSYLVIGFDRKDLQPSDVATRLRSLAAVALCIDPVTVKVTGEMTGVTPENFVIGPDGKYEGIFCFRKHESDDHQFVSQVRTALEEAAGANLDGIAIGGPAAFRVALDSASQHRLPEVMIAILVVGGLLLWWITGRASCALTAVGAIVMSQIVLVGSLSWRGIPMDMSLSMVPPMMMALGFSYAAHRALRQGITITLLLCLTTTALGIGSFATTNLAPIRAFALYGVVGLALVWLAVISLVRPPENPHLSRSSRVRWMRPALQCCLTAVERNPRAILLFGAAAMLAPLVAGRLLVFETNPLNYFPPESQIRRDFATLDRRLTGMLPFQVTIRGSADPTRLLAQTPGVRKVIEISSFLPGRSSTYWCLADNEALPSLVNSQSVWREWARDNNTEIAWLGVAAQLHQVSMVISRVALLSLPAMGLAAALAVGCLRRSIRLAVVSAWVNLLPVAALVVLAGLTKWPLDLPSLMVGAISVGMAVDDTLHIVDATRKHGSVRRAMLRCWRPCVGSSLVTAVCMSLFAISSFRPTVQFGLLMAFATAVALAGDLLILPVCASVKSRASGKVT